MLAGFYLIRAYQPTMKAVYPTQCAFLFDDAMSPAMRQQVQEVVQQQYDQHRDPELVVQKVSDQFPQVVAMDAYICKTDKLCFSFDLAQPLFTLNDSLVVCSNKQLLNKDCYRHDVVKHLRGLAASVDESLEQLSELYRALSAEILDQFKVEWVNQNEIVLRQDGSSDVLLFSLACIPCQRDIDQFKQLIQSDKLKKQKKKRVFDFRFHNQVIVR